MLHKQKIIFVSFLFIAFFAVLSVPAQAQLYGAEVEFDTMSFFEGGDNAPEEYQRNYTTNFPLSSTRYVWCQVKVKNLLYNVREHKHEVTWQYYNANGSLHGEVKRDDFLIKPDWDNPVISHGWGWSKAGNWPLGTYTVHILIDGKKVGEKNFTVFVDENVSPETLQASLYNAAMDGDESVVKDLLAKGADPNTQNIMGVPALQTAASGGHTGVVRILLDYGADINSQDMMGWSPLISAANSGHTETVSLLLDRGADIEAKDIISYPALLYAASSGHTETVKILLERGANPNSGIDNYDSLMAAAGDGQTEVVKLLLEHGAEVNPKAETNMSALIYAAKAGHLEVVRVLVDKGADLTIKDEKGRTALEWAEFEQHKEVAELLKKGKPKGSFLDRFRKRK